MKCKYFQGNKVGTQHDSLDGYWINTLFLITGFWKLSKHTLVSDTCLGYVLLVWELPPAVDCKVSSIHRTWILARWRHETNVPLICFLKPAAFDKYLFSRQRHKYQYRFSSFILKCGVHGLPDMPVHHHSSVDLAPFLLLSLIKGYPSCAHFPSILVLCSDPNPGNPEALNKVNFTPLVHFWGGGVAPYEDSGWKGAKEQTGYLKALHNGKRFGAIPKVSQPHLSQNVCWKIDELSLISNRLKVFSGLPASFRFASAATCAIHIGIKSVRCWNWVKPLEEITIQKQLTAPTRQQQNENQCHLRSENGCPILGVPFTLGQGHKLSRFCTGDLLQLFWPVAHDVIPRAEIFISGDRSVVPFVTVPSIIESFEVLLQWHHWMWQTIVLTHHVEAKGMHLGKHRDQFHRIAQVISSHDPWWEFILNVTYQYQ